MDREGNHRTFDAEKKENGVAFGLLTIFFSNSRILARFLIESTVFGEIWFGSTVFGETFLRKWLLEEVLGYILYFLSIAYHSN